MQSSTSHPVVLLVLVRGKELAALPPKHCHCFCSVSIQVTVFDTVVPPTVTCQHENENQVYNHVGPHVGI